MALKGVIPKTEMNAVDKTHFAVDAGTGTLSSGTDAITTKLATITHATITLNVAGAPGDTTSVFSWTAVAGVLTVFGWKPISGTDPTLVAATDADTFSWFAIGT